MDGSCPLPGLGRGWGRVALPRNTCGLISFLLFKSTNVGLHYHEYECVQPRSRRANVLYMDGHVEFMKCPGNEFPVKEGLGQQ